MTRQIVLITTAIFLVGCASSQPGDNGELYGREDVDQSQTAVRDMSGFSGYAWGTSIEFVTSSMNEEGYELISSETEDVWYRGIIGDEGLQLVYYFENDMLISGMWIFDSVDPKSYWKIDEFLRNEYNSDAKQQVRGDDWIESEMVPPGTDARIVHGLDVKADRHVVYYYFADNLVAEEAAGN